MNTPTGLQRGTLLADAVETKHASETMTRVAKVALGTATGAGGVLAWANPEGVPILVHDLVLDVTTQATGTPTVDAGIAADGTTSSDTLIDGQAVGAAPVVLSSARTGGTNGGSHRKMTASQFLTITASADPAGLVGSAYIAYSIL